MACKYNYKGRIFNSELELDDYLLELKYLEPIIGDMAFSTEMSHQQKVAVGLCNGVITEAAKASDEAFREAREHGTNIIYDDEGEIAYEKPPRYGVNKFLADFRDAYEKRLFPEFIKENYWRERYKDWANGYYNDSEKEVFGITTQTGPKISPSDTIVVDGREISRLLHMSDLMEAKWKVLAKTGDAIHECLKICFQKYDKIGKLNLLLDDASLFNYIKRVVGSGRNKDYINDQAILDAIKHARNLYNELKTRYDINENSVFFPEFSIVSQITHEGLLKELFGNIDLLIIDLHGTAHIIDYKTSIHNYGEFSPVKKMAYNYQLSFYQRMIENYGVNVRDGKLLVYPIKIKNLRKEGDTYVYDGLEDNQAIDDLTSKEINNKMWDIIDLLMPKHFDTPLIGENVGLEVTETMSEWFPTYSNTKIYDEAKMRDELIEQGRLLKDENGFYIYERYNDSPIKASDDVTFVREVMNWKNNLPSRRLKYTSLIKNAIKDAIKNGIESVDFPINAHNSSKESTVWLRDLVAQYCDDNWEVVDKEDMPGVEELENYGMILLKTKSDRPGIAPQYDVIRVTTDVVTADYRLYRDRKYKNREADYKMRTNLTGAFEPDVVEKTKGRSLMLAATNGNVELMETMAVLNLFSGFNDIPIGEIKVVNPIDANGISASNEELLYCWTALNKHKAVKHDRFRKGEIQLASKYEIVNKLLNHILVSAEATGFTGEYRYARGLKSCMDSMDSAINGSAEDKIRALQNLLNLLDNSDSKGLQAIIQGNYTKKTGNSLQKYIDLRNNILLAIAQLRGVDFRQLLRDHDSWAINALLTKGVRGNIIDNPGNLESATLNLLTEQATIAYLNTRDEMLRARTKIYEAIEKFRRKKMSIASEVVGANLTSIYRNLFDTDNKNDFMFKHLDLVNDPDERELLTFVLDTINKNRFKGLSQEALDDKRDRNDPAYYMVPLAYGDNDSQTSTRGLLGHLRNKLKYLTPSKMLEETRKKAEGFFDSDVDLDNQKSSLILYKMKNLFSKSEDPKKRHDFLTKNDTRTVEEGIKEMEHNLEALLYKHTFAYSLLKNMDEVFPLIRASIVHILNQGIVQNTKFSEDLKYAEDYVRNKIFNQSILDKKLSEISLVTSKVKLAASIMTLAFAPVQMIYQPLQGLWTDLSLIWRKSDGKQSFTFEHFKNAFKIAYRDLGHFSDKPSFCQLLNETFGLNDMDMNLYAEKLSTHKKGIRNLMDFAMKFSSRPDYYNRLTIFLSLMQGDGCLEAVSVKDDKLVYDWTKDKRYSVFASDPKGERLSNNPEWIKQRAYYYAAALLFVNEHTLVEKDGEIIDFKIDMSNPMPLPKVYTNKEAESMKSLADDIYGYYSHEKKSMIMSTLIGSMWLQFKTYWSGKKNLYLQSGGVRIRGLWKPYSETKTVTNGDGTTSKKTILYYYQTNDDGTINRAVPPLAEDDPNLKNKNAPVVLWEGLWQEGILLTVSDLFREAISLKSLKIAISNKWNNPDENLRLAYLNNLKLLGYDLLMFLVVGNILGYILSNMMDDLKKEHKNNRDAKVGAAIAAANVLTLSVRNSFLDFNWFDSIGSPTVQWSPFALEWGLRQWKLWSNVAMHDEDFWDGAVKTFGSTKQIKPFLDSIKPDAFRTVSEGGTFNAE